jgi:hypothetical protein
VFIINNNYRGHLINDIIYTEKQNKILFKKDDSFFKQNIYYYFDKTNNVTLYYNSTNLNYLGYKEQSKDYVKIYNSGSMLKKILSIKNKLLFLGYSNLNYKISDDILKINNMNKQKTELILFVSNIIRNRIINLKKILLNIQTIFYQVKNKFSVNNNPIINKFIDKFKIIETKNNFKFFDDINILIKSIFFTKLDSNISFYYDNNYINVENIIKIKNGDNILINYFCDQIKLLIDVNTNTFTKNNLIFLFCNLINYEFNLNTIIDQSNSIPDIKKILLNEYYYNYYIVSGEIDIDDVEITNTEIIQLIKDDNFVNLDEITKVEIEEKYDIIEEENSLDVDFGDINDNDDDDDDDNQLYTGYYSGEIE